jgi:hypothetical protein
MLSFHEVNILGNICDSTVGRSSTVNSPTMSIKTRLQGDKFSVTYMTIVNLASVYEMRDLTKRYEEEAAGLINDYMKNVRKNFKTEAGRSLKVKELSSSDTFDVITASAFSPKRNAYYKRTATFHVE